MKQLFEEYGDIIVILFIFAFIAGNVLGGC